MSVLPHQKISMEKWGPTLQQMTFISIISTEKAKFIDFLLLWVFEKEYNNLHPYKTNQTRNIKVAELFPHSEFPRNKLQPARTSYTNSYLLLFLLLFGWQIRFGIPTSPSYKIRISHPKDISFKQVGCFLLMCLLHVIYSYDFGWLKVNRFQNKTIKIKIWPPTCPKNDIPTITNLPPTKPWALSGFLRQPPLNESNLRHRPRAVHRHWSRASVILGDWREFWGGNVEQNFGPIHKSCIMYWINIGYLQCFEKFGSIPFPCQSS